MEWHAHFDLRGKLLCLAAQIFLGPSFCQSGPSWFNSVPSLPVLGSQGGAYLPSRVQQQVMSEHFSSSGPRTPGCAQQPVRLFLQYLSRICHVPGLFSALGDRRELS